MPLKIIIIRPQKNLHRFKKYNSNFISEHLILLLIRD